MNDVIQKYQDQLQVFNHVKFISDNHSYLINDQAAISVTQLLNSYVRPFDREYWSKVKASNLGVSPDEILSKWEQDSKLSITKGIVVHSYIESLFGNSNFTYPQEQIVFNFGHDPIQDSFHKIVDIANKFKADIKDKMYPIASEFIVGDSEYLVGGTLDQIFYNVKSGQLEIWDWKTNKEIKTQSRYKHLHPINHIPDCELEHYSLQLSLYKVIVEKNTGLSLGNGYLTWFNENMDDYVVFKTKDYTNEVKVLLDNQLKG